MKNTQESIALTVNIRTYNALTSFQRARFNSASMRFILAVFSA